MGSYSPNHLFYLRNTLAAGSATVHITMFTVLRKHKLLLLAFMFDLSAGHSYKTARSAEPAEKEPMANDKVTTVIGPSGEDEKRVYERSTIEFPYNDLDDAVEVAQAVHEKGGLACTLEQLAAQLGLSATSGTFRGRVSNAGTFRLTQNSAGEVRLAELGRQIIDPSQSKKARVSAFLAVPLYAKIFENYKKTLLPPPSALERAIVGFGVSSKQAGRARQAFMRSAEQAGFFEHGKDKLVLPGNVDASGTFVDTPATDHDPCRNGGGGGPPSDLNLDPLLIELLKKIPLTEEGWPASKRVRWFRTFAMNVSEIYDAEGEPVELKIDLEAS